MYGNPYYNQQQRYQPMNMGNQQMVTQPYVQPIPATIPQQSSLLGKVVESIDVVKAMDIPLDGSVSYFPLSDGSAIVSKQLQNDGTSKLMIYKPSDDKKEETIQFVTFDEVQDMLNDLDINDIQDLKDDIKEIKKQLKEFKSKKSKDE